MNLTNKHISIILLGSLLLVITLFKVLQLNENSTQPDYKAGDAGTYENAAKLLYQHNFKTDPNRPYFYPLILGIPYLITDNDQTITYWGYILNISCWLLTIFLLYKTINTFLNERASLLLTLLFGLNISNIVITNQNLSESIFTLTFFIVISRILIYIQSHDLLQLHISILALCITIIIKPGTFVLLPVLGAYLIYERVNHLGWFSKKFLIYPMIGILLLTIQGLQNKKHYNSFSISHIGNVTWYLYAGAQAKSYHYITDIHNEISQRNSILNSLDYKQEKKVWLKVDSISKDDLKKQLHHNPKSILQSIKTNILGNATSGADHILTLKNRTNNNSFEKIKSTFYKISVMQNTCYSLAVIAIIAVSMLTVFKRKRFGNNTIVGILVINTLITTIIITSGLSFWQGDRFHIILVPGIILFGAFLYARIFGASPTS